MSEENEAAIWDAVNSAEEVSDPLDGLVEESQSDPGAPFVPEVLHALCDLRRTSPSDFESLRARLKSETSVRVTQLDSAMDELSGSQGGRGPTQADILVALVEDADLFHTSDGEAYADLHVRAHRETWPIRGRGFRRWLTERFYQETGGAPNSDALQSALNVIEARASFDGDTRPVGIRVAGHDSKLYLDLANDDWEAVEIDSDDWRIVSEPPVRFRRTPGMLALPRPARGGSVDALRAYLNLTRNGDFVLVVAWMLAVLRDRGPFPVLVLSGEQGSAKSTFCAMLRRLVDPNTAPLRALPREDRDLFIAANNGYLLAFDNVSGLPHWTSDTMCRLATGGGFSVRRLYSDQEEVLFEAARPMVLNGIEDFVTRPDLADRSIVLLLQPIPPERRKAEADLWAAFDEDRPRILGALLDAVSHGLAHLAETRHEELPRMADFALWATACEGALWDAGTFGEAYSGNLEEAVDNVIESDPVASAIRALIGARASWTGNATELLDELAKVVGESARAAKGWPRTPRMLSGQVRRAATFLRSSGIEIEYSREGRNRDRVIHIRAVPESQRSHPHAGSAETGDSDDPFSSNGTSPKGERTVEADADARHQPTVRRKSLSTRSADGADGADGADANGDTETVRWSARL